MVSAASGWGPRRRRTPTKRRSLVRLRGARVAADRRRDRAQAHQLADPARRAEHHHHAAGPFGLGYFDSIVRNVDANPRPRVKQGNGERVSRSPRRSSPTYSGSTRRAGSRPCSTATMTRSMVGITAGWRPVPASRSRASTPTSRPATTPASPTTTLATRRSDPLRPASSSRRGRADLRAIRRIPTPSRFSPAPARPFLAAGLGHALVHLQHGDRDSLVQGDAAAGEGSLPRGSPSAAWKCASCTSTRSASRPGGDELFAAFGVATSSRSFVRSSKAVPQKPDRRDGSPGAIPARSFGNSKKHGFGWGELASCASPRGRPATTRSRPVRLPLHLARHRRRGSGRTATSTTRMQVARGASFLGAKREATRGSPSATTSLARRAPARATTAPRAGADPAQTTQLRPRPRESTPLAAAWPARAGSRRCASKFEVISYVSAAQRDRIDFFKGAGFSKVTPPPASTGPSRAAGSE